jgi:hypothetical protein
MSRWRVPCLRKVIAYGPTKTTKSIVAYWCTVRFDSLWWSPDHVQAKYCIGPPATPTPALSAFNFLPNFYKVNPAEIGYSASYKTSDPLYLLVDWNDAGPTQTTYLNKGYFLLGHCDFNSDIGEPLRGYAIEYAKQLGADLVIYAEQTTPNGRSDSRSRVLKCS